MSGPYGSGSFGTGTFSNSPFYDTAGIINAILRSTNHNTPANETNKRTVILNMINNRYMRVTTSRHWNFLFASLDTTFEAPYETGTVNVTKGSENVVGVGTAFSSNIVPNNKLIIGQYVNLINTVSSPTALQLEGEYSGETATGLSFKIVKPIVTMPADLESIHSILIDGVGELVPIGIQELRRKQQFDPTRIGPPAWYTELFRRAADGIRVIEVYPAPDQKYNVHLDYGVNIQILLDATDNYPLIPDRYRNVLYYGALAEFQEYLRNPVGQQIAEVSYQSVLRDMQADSQLTDSRLIFQPARNYRQRALNRRRYSVTMDRSDFGRDG